jgi:hypothetical protein
MARSVCRASLGTALQILFMPLCICHIQRNHHLLIVSLGISLYLDDVQLEQSADSTMHTQRFRWSNPSTARHRHHAAAAAAAQLTCHPLSLTLALPLSPFLPVMIACPWLPAVSERDSVTRSAASRSLRVARLQTVRQ